jgi:hypothetical protein
MSKVKVTDEIYQVGGGPLTEPEDAAIYLIDFDGHAALVDAGCGYSYESLLANVRACGVGRNRSNCCSSPTVTSTTPGEPHR